METKGKKRSIVSYMVASTCLAILAIGVGAKAPGLGVTSVLAPKTLDQVEPRMPISSLPFVIGESGSYYVTSDLTLDVPDQNGIEVDANDVTVDLMGYSLIGLGSGQGDGIHMAGRINVEIRNGTVRNWGGNGIYEDGGNVHTIVGVRVRSNNGSGMFLSGSGHCVRDCTAAWNGGHGIAVAGGCTLDRNTVNGNAYVGISAGSDCTVTNNTSSDNWAAGMMIGGGCTVATNTLDDNQWPTDLLPATTLGTGTGLLVTGQGCLIRDNTLRGNSDANIRVKSTHNALENNLVTGAKYGIYFEEIGNFYANNRASGNTTNYMKAPSSNSPGDGGGNASF